MFSVDPLDGRSPLSVDFKSLSYDPDGEIVAHEWDFGDGQVGSGQDVTHTFVSETDREFRVRLTVTDDSAATDSHTGWVDVYGSDTDPSVMFFDDFESGLDPAWRMAGDWWISEGWLECRIGPSLKYAYVLDGKEWTDYAIEVDLDPSGGSAAIIVRCSEDLQDYVLLIGSYSWIRWWVFETGTLISQTEIVTPGFFEGVSHVRVEVHGNEYLAYVEGLLRSQFTYSGRTHGMPGLAGKSNFGHEPRFDNFRVTSLE